MTTDTPVSSSPAPASAVAVPLKGLPTEVSEWIFRAQEPLAREIARVQSAPELALDDEPTLAVERLPEATRQFLWRGLQRHHPALAELVRDPIIAETRATFGASLHLRVADLLTVILQAFRAQQALTGSSRTPLDGTKPRPSTETVVARSHGDRKPRATGDVRVPAAARRGRPRAEKRGERQ